MQEFLSQFHFECRRIARSSQHQKLLSRIKHFPNYYCTYLNWISVKIIHFNFLAVEVSYSIETFFLKVKGLTHQKPESRIVPVYFPNRINTRESFG